MAFAAGIVVALGVISSGASAAVTYHGTFSGPVTYERCNVSPTTVASGTWNVVLHENGTATLTVNIFTNGVHHVTFGGGRVQQVTIDGSPTFAVQTETLAGVLTVALWRGTTLTYTIPKYEYGGISCPTGSVTYHGTTG